jgi:hypothetical protein
VSSVKALGTIYRYWLTLLWLAVVAEIAAAAYGGFYSAEKLGDQKGSDESKMISEKVFDHGFGFHTVFGYIIFFASVVLLLLAIGARVGKRRILFALAVPVAVAIQILLAWLSEDVHGIGILHGINALVVFGLTGSMAGMAWRAARAAPASPAAPS